MLVFLVIVTYWPELSLWLPRAMKMLYALFRRVLRAGHLFGELLAALVVRHAEDEALRALQERVRAVHFLVPVLVASSMLRGRSSMKASCEPLPPNM